MTEPNDGSGKSALGTFLDKIDGTEVPYVSMTPDAENPYCDSCSDPIRPNREIQLYGVDKIITGHEAPAAFRMLRLHCPDCRLPRLVFGCEGYNEILLDAEVDTDWVIHDPEVVDTSGADSGIPYDPKEVLEDLFEVSYDQLLAMSGGEAQGPLDAVDILVILDIDPREVIHDDGSVTVRPAHRRKLAENGARIMKKDMEGDLPPQPTLASKMAGWADMEEPED